MARSCRRNATWRRSSASRSAPCARRSATWNAGGLLVRVQGSGNYVRSQPDVASVYSMFRLELVEGGGLPTAQVLSVDRLAKPLDLPPFGSDARRASDPAAAQPRRQAGCAGGDLARRIACRQDRRRRPLGLALSLLPQGARHPGSCAPRTASAWPPCPTGRRPSLVPPPGPPPGLSSGSAGRRTAPARNSRGPGSITMSRAMWRGCDRD